MSKLATLIPAIREHLDEIAAKSVNVERQELAEAEQIIKSIPSLIANAIAGTGLDCVRLRDVKRLHSARVMHLDLGLDWSFPDECAKYKSRSPESSWLHTKARAVFDYCAKYELRPNIVPDYGETYRITIEWDPVHIDRLLTELDNK